MRSLDEALSFLFSHEPQIASYMGLRDYDFLVPSLTPQAFDEFLNSLPDVCSKVREEEPENEELALDKEQILRELRQTLIVMEGWKYWKSYPLAPSVATDLLLSIVMSKANEEHKRRALAERIKAIPKLLEESKELLEKPYSLWVSLAQAELQGLKLMLLDLNAPNEVLESLDKYSDWLGSLSAEEGFLPMGPETFEAYMNERYIKENVYEFAERAKKEALELKEELGEKPKMEEVESDKEAYAEAVKRAKAFVVEKKVVPLAYDEELEIADTPEPLRPLIPYAAYFGPQRFSPYNVGVLVVTPGSAKREKFDILNTAVHETYPGHHVQLSYPLPTRYRAFAQATDYVEGWAHYSEELMLELGFEKDERYAWQVKKDALWRLVRVYVDVYLSTGKMSYEEAMRELVEVAMLDEASARAEVLRYTLTPGYQLSYAYGKMRIKEMRDAVKEIEGSSFSLYEFHKRLLSLGALPVDRVKELLTQG